MYSPPSGYRIPAQQNGSPYGAFIPGIIGKIRAFLPGSIPFPPGITPLLWLDGRVQSFSDAASTVPANPQLGRVARSPQPSPLSGNWASSDALNSRCFRDTSSYCFEPTPNASASPFGNNLFVPNSIPGNACAVGFNLCNRTSPLVDTSSVKGIIYGTDLGNGHIWSVLLVNNEFCVYHDNVLWHSTIFCPLATPVAGVVRFTSTGVDIKTTVGSNSLVAAVPAGTIGNIVAGLCPAFNEGLAASVSQLLVTSALSDPQRDSFLNWLIAYPPALAFPSNVNLETVAGDSIAQGFGLSSYQSWFYRQLVAVEGIGAQVKALNAGLPGRDISQLQTFANSTLIPMASNLRSRQLCIAQVGTNSLAFGSLTAAQAYGQYWALCDSLRPFYKIIACTILPRTDGGIRGDYVANRALYNTEISTNWASHADALCDFGGIAGMSTAADTTGANYQGDHVHPSIAGHVLLTNLIQPIAVGLMS